MAQNLKNHIAKFVAISDKEFEDIFYFFKSANFKKKQNLVEAGEISRCHFFVLSGCLRKYFVNVNGVEQTTEFAIENWWITDNMAFEHQAKTDFYIQAVENSQVLFISANDQERLLQQYPKMERYFRFIYQRAYAAAQLRFRYLYEFSKEEFYLHLTKNHPEFVQRIPQYLIASFLGFTPEYLSEIRSKKRS